MTAICKVTNGVQSVSLVGDAFYISSWNPAGLAFKDDGHWNDAVFSDGRTLSRYDLANYTETITINQRSLSQDDAIRQANKLAGLLLEAAEFSVKPKHGRRPVYLEVKASQESNTRYAHIHAGFVGEYGNPFSQPFLQYNCNAAVANINVVIERGPWLEVPPGTDTCQIIAPTGTPGEAVYHTYEDILLGRPTHSLVSRNDPESSSNYVITWPAFGLWKLNDTSGIIVDNSSDFPGLDGRYGGGQALANLRFWDDLEPTAFMSIGGAGNVSLYSAAFQQMFNGEEGSLLAWVNTSGLIWTGGNDAYFINLEVDSTHYIRIYHPGTIENNSVQWEYAVGSVSSWRESNFSPTDSWFSIGMTWSQSQLGFPNVRFYLNGSLVAYRNIGSGITGSLDPDLVVAGQSNDTGSDGAASDMAWIAMWNAPLTDDDMALIGVPNFGFVESTALPCEDIVAYVANKSTMSRLTHAYRFDSSATTFSGNLITLSPPQALLPSPLGVNDYVAFGIRATAAQGLPSGPFNSIVLDIATALTSTGNYAYTWEYWSGAAWAALDFVDNTLGFRDTNIHAVHWVQPDDWAQTSVNSITGFWVRMRITSLSGAQVQPVMQDVPYTILHNTVDIPALGVGGSMPALARLRLENSAEPINNDHNMFWERVIVGMRSYDLAPNFVSYINLTDRRSHNPPGITVAVGTNASFIDDTTSVTGRSIRLVAGSTTMLSRWTVKMNLASVPSYLGSYKAFVLYTQTNPGTTENTVQLRLKAGTGYNHTVVDGGVYITSQAIPAPAYTVHEMGEIIIRPDTFFGDNLDEIEFSWWSTTSTNLDIAFHALVLIPTDEWFGDFGTDPITSNLIGQVTGERYLSLDSTRYVDRAVVADVREISNDKAVARWRQSHNGPIKINHSGRQVLHFLFTRTDHEARAYYASGASPHAAARVKIYKNRRYGYGRGDQ